MVKTMNDDFSKVFDVSKPSRTNPDSTSRPIIVGHRPSMPDPMMRPVPTRQSVPPATVPAPAGTPPVTVPPIIHGMAGIPSTGGQEAVFVEHHEPKVISVSDDVRSEIDASKPHLPPISESAPPATNTAPGPTGPAIVSTSPPRVDTPATGFISTATVSGGNIVSPVAGTATPAAAPQVVVPEVHHQSLPMGHAPSSGASRLKNLILWLFIIVFLAAFVGYLAVDAGFVSTSLKLPFHIFDRQG
jgi:hypothetical protein